jgi:hypothetical protein
VPWEQRSKYDSEWFVGEGVLVKGWNEGNGVEEVKRKKKNVQTRRIDLVVS